MKPYTICHMLISIDGKVTGKFLFEDVNAAATEEYYRLNRAFHADAFACGRVTMEGSFTGGHAPDLTPFADAEVAKEDYIADSETRFFAVSFDRQGRLGWTTPKIIDEDPGYGGAHIIEVLTHQVSSAYLAYLRSIGISYIFAGEEDIDISLALEKLREKFDIKKLLLEGGSIINGAFQRAGAVDELSLVSIPTVAGADALPLFYNGELEAYELLEARKLDGGALWLHYVKK